MVSRYFMKYKFAFWGHVYNMQVNPKSLGNRFRHFFNNQCDWWFGYTKGAKKYLMNARYPEERITVVQNAIDTIGLQSFYSSISDSDIHRLRSDLKITGQNVGIYCGGMYPDKGFEFILKTCDLIKARIPDFHMIFIGSGIEDIKIRSAAEKFNWIHYIGPKFSKDRVIYFKISSIQIMPKLVGLCILDSFAMETPLITTDHPFHGPEIDYLENGINGIMTRYDTRDYAETIIEILNSKKYLSLIEAGKISANKYTVKNMAENFAKGIISCLEN